MFFKGVYLFETLCINLQYNSHCMKLLKIIPVLLLVFFSSNFSLQSQIQKKKKKKTTASQTVQPFSYTAELRKVDSLIFQVSQLKAAEELLNTLQPKALSEQQNGYYIRCVQSRLNLATRNAESNDTLDNVWAILISEIKQGNSDVKIFLSLDAAKRLDEIIEARRWRDSDETIPDDSSTMPENWSDEKLNKIQDELIQQAIQLSSTGLPDKVLLPLFLNNENLDFALSVRQIVALEAINILKGENTDVLPPFQDGFAEAARFSAINFSTQASANKTFRIFELYQQLLTPYHVYFDLKRLQYAQSIYPNNTEAYYDACEKAMVQNIRNPFSNLMALAYAEKYKTDKPALSLSIINEALKRHPSFFQNSQLVEFKSGIIKPELSIQIETVYQPNKKQLSKVIYKNINQLYVTVFKTSYLSYYKLTKDIYGYNEESKNNIVNFIKNNGNLGKTYTIDVPVYTDYKNHSAEIALEAMPAGYYMIAISSTKNIEDSQAVVRYSALSVSDYAFIEEEDVLKVVYAENGSSASGKKYKLYSKVYKSGEGYNYDFIKNGTTDTNGIIIFPKIKDWSENYLVELEQQVIWEKTYYRNGEDKKQTPPLEKDRYHIMTDRSIYRPGQKVFFKCIVYKENEKVTVANKAVTIALRDNNYEIKDTLFLRTNQYGSVSGELQLPTSGMNTGNFQITANFQENINISVEEYKRPKYMAKIKVPEKGFKLFDSVIVVGEAKAFAGYGIQDAKVNYTVIRKQKPNYYYGWWYKSYMPESNSKTMVSGETITDLKGEFKIGFKALPDETIDKNSNPYFIYEISATIVDINGETHSANYSMTMAYTDRELSISSNDEGFLGESMEVKYSSKNLQNQVMPFTGSISIKKLMDAPRIYRQKYWEPSDTIVMTEQQYKDWLPDYAYSVIPKDSLIATYSFTEDKKGNYRLPVSLFRVSGDYIAVISSFDGNGKVLESSCKFSINPSKPGSYTLPNVLKAYVLNGRVFEPGETAKVLISSGATKAIIRVVAKSKRGLILKRQYVIDRSTKLIEFPITEKDRGDIIIHLTTVYNYRYYNEVVTIPVSYSNKELEVTLQSFRSETEPGAKEKWIVTLKGPAAEKAAMESVAVMYDQSLDELKQPNNWPLSLYYRYDDYFSAIDNLNSKSFNWLKDVVINYPYFRQFQYQLYSRSNTITLGLYDRRSYFMSGIVGYKGVSPQRNRGKFKEEDSDGVSVAYDREFGDGNLLQKVEVGNVSYHGYTVGAGTYSIEYEKIEATTPAIRKNFSETVFFYPHMYANAKGEITLEFTMPEALTQWKMRMLSHSTTMQAGYLEQSITTSKKVMVQPNMPRFLREGDAITIASKIVNTTGQILLTTAKISIKDDATGQELPWLTNNGIQLLSIPANSSVPVGFKLKIPEYTGLVTIAITAISGAFSDGEQHTLAVLSNRILITETLPITIRQQGTQQLVFKHLKDNSSTTLAHRQLSVEMSSNPAWYAIKALPYMMEFPNECAEQLFTRLYANSIGIHIASTHPEVKKVYDSWQREAASGKGLQSKLMDNPDLKTTLLEETPWLYEAKNETEQMRKLGALFNTTKMKEEQIAAFEKLKELQMNDGGFSWFKGMQSSSYITQTIVIGFGKMKAMGIDISAYSGMIKSAMKFLDDEATRDYNYYMKQKDKFTFYPANLQYIYCKSYFPKYGLDVKDKVVMYFTDNAEKTWHDNGMLNRAQLATALHKMRPQSTVPALIIRAFTETAKKTNDDGMYWSENSGGYYWYQAPLETQAAIIEAFTLITPNSADIKEQQIWLLRQKQTQHWSSTRSTADACYALLMRGDFLNSKQSVTVKVNNMAVVPQVKEEGTGYYRQNIPKEEIKNASGDIQVEAATSDFAYGAIYWQYFEQMDKVQKNAGELSITKRLYKVSTSEKGKVRTEVLPGDTLKVGDIIEVSLTINANKNLEFVHIKDLRAAGTEPVDVLSEYHWQNGLGYYQSTRDANTSFFSDNMPKGIYQLNYTLKVEQAGEFNCGLATIQCLYAPEYTANSKSISIRVNP